MLQLDQVVQRTREQLSPERIAHREAALAEARTLLASTLGVMTEAHLRRLLQLFNTDFVNNRETANRFAGGLLGKVNLLAKRMDGVNAAVPQLWTADEEWLRWNLGGLRHGGSLPGGGWLFVSMVLHARSPDTYLPMTWTMVEVLASLDGGPLVSTREGSGYLEFCRRGRALLAAHGLSPHGADVLLWASANNIGKAKDEAEPEEAATQSSEAPVAPILSFPTVRLPRAESEVKLHLRTIFESPSPATIPLIPRPAPPDTTPAPEPKTRSIGWLHLTDLHQGMHGSGWLWPNVLWQVLDDLRRLHDLCGPWDLVFFTGDLTQRGTAAEYNKLDETLARIWRHFETLGSNPKLVCVPGNHDLVRPGELDPVALALSLWQERPALRDHVFGSEDNPYRARLREIFAPYSEWARRAPWLLRDGIVEGAMPGDFSLTLTLDGIDLGIVGLNSSFLQLTGGDYQGRLDVDPRQLHHVCDHYPPEWLQRHHVNLLLTHHPPEWLAPRAKQDFFREIDLPGRFVAHFFGHMHEGASTSISHGGGPARHAIQGASLFGLETHEGADGRDHGRIHGYSAGRFELGHGDGPAQVQARIFPRRLFSSASSRRIDRDVQGYELDDRGSFTFAAPAGKKLG